MIRALGARTGERHLSDVGPDCQNLADALALTLAIILDNDEGRASIEPESSADTRADRWKAIDHEQGTTLAAELGAALGFHAGALDTGGSFVSVEGRLWFGRGFAVSVGGFWAGDQTVFYDERPPGRLELELASAFLGACLRLTALDVAPRVALCAEPYLGRLRGTGAGFDGNRPPQDHLWLAGALALAGAGRIAGPLHWQLKAAGLLVRENRFNVVLNGQPDTVFQSSPAAILASAGLFLHFE